MFFWNSLAFSMIQWMSAIWSVIPLPFLNPAWTSNFMVHVLLKPGLENFEHYFASVWDEYNCALVWTSFGIAFLCDWNESWPFPVLWPGDLPNPGIEPRSSTLQVNSLPSEPAGKPKNTGVGSLSLFQGIFPTQESNQGLLHCRWIPYQLSYQGSPLSWPW